MAHVVYDHSFYKWSHGRRAQGFGRWAFKVADWESPDEIIWAHGALAQCKRQILEKVKPAKGARIVAFVQP